MFRNKEIKINYIIQILHKCGLWNIFVLLHQIQLELTMNQIVVRCGSSKKKEKTKQNRNSKLIERKKEIIKKIKKCFAILQDEYEGRT